MTQRISCSNCGCREDTHPIPECKKYDPRLLMTKQMTAEQLAQHIASEWGPLEADERVKMIVVVRNMLDTALAQSREEGFEDGKKEAAEICDQIPAPKDCMDAQHDDRWCPNCQSMEEGAKLCAERIRALRPGGEGVE